MTPEWFLIVFETPVHYGHIYNRIEEKGGMLHSGVKLIVRGKPEKITDADWQYENVADIYFYDREGNCTDYLQGGELCYYSFNTNNTADITMLKVSFWYKGGNEIMAAFQACIREFCQHLFQEMPVRFAGLTDHDKFDDEQAAYDHFIKS